MMSACKCGPARDQPLFFARVDQSPRARGFLGEPDDDLPAPLERRVLDVAFLNRPSEQMRGAVQ